MGKKKELFLAAILFASTCVGSALAGTSQDSQLLSSTQTYKLNRPGFIGGSQS
jgi:hypothetical protein